MLSRCTRRTFKPGRNVLAPSRMLRIFPAKNGSRQTCSRSGSRRSCRQSPSLLARRTKKRINNSSKTTPNERWGVTSRSWTSLMSRIPLFWSMIPWQGLATTNQSCPELTVNHSCHVRAVGQSVSSQLSIRAKPFNKRSQPVTSFLTLAKSWWPRFRSQTKLRRQNCWKSTSSWRKRSLMMGKRLSRRTRTSMRSIKMSLRTKAKKLRSKSGTLLIKACNCSKRWWT